jgi:prepilin-type N-terminal cleavage/methylation domain-containing protein
VATVRAERIMMARGKDEHGLTLIEMMIAIFVIGVVLMAMAATAIAAQRSMQTSERVVQATQLANEILETYLARDFEDLGLYADDVDAAFGAGTTTYDSAALVIFPQPVTPDYDRVPKAYDDFPDRDDVNYEARTAVVWASDTDPAVTDQFKRIIVELTWEVRGEQRTSTVESLIARNPADQMLTVVVEPDTVMISETGMQSGSFTITVTAKDPQSVVNVSWEDRDGSKATTGMTSSDGLIWTRTLDGKRFANGGTLFTVVGTLAGTTQKDVTTIGRALFLQPLDLDATRTTITPAALSYHPVTGYCESGITVQSDAYGAIFSDPMIATFNTLAYPMEAIEPPLTEGTRYRIQLGLNDLNIANGDTVVAGMLQVTRPTDGSVPVELPVAIPINVLPEQETMDDGTKVYAPCP